MIRTALSFLGSHAKWVLPAGIIIALILPDIDARWDIILPINITMIYAASMIRLDLRHCLRTALTPKHLGVNIGFSLFILCLVPALYLAIAKMFGLTELFLPSLIWYAVAPPIASTVWICTLLGFRATLAMEVVVLTSLAAPFTGPFLAPFFLSEITAVDQLSLFYKLAGMICGGTLIALIGQTVFGREKITDNKLVFDGLSALAMLVFLIPVFNGVTDKIAADPMLAVWLCCLAIGMNMGAQFLLLIGSSLKPKLTSQLQVLAIVTGNRNVGLYFAALPPDPIFGLFTAMYQVPLYLTPLVISRLCQWLYAKQHA